MKRKIRQKSERGAVAVLFAALVLVLFGVAALGVDLASQVNRKHLLINQLDSSATAAAAKLGENGSIAAAVQAAVDYFAQSGQGTLDTSKIDFWCVVAQKANTTANPRVNDAQIPTTTQAGGVCNPDAVAGEDGKFWKSGYGSRARASDGKLFSMTCNGTLCAVPCALQARSGNGWNPGNSTYNARAIKCNTIRVGAKQNVPFSFAGVMGIDEGSTGSQISVACAGSCGTVAPNPMDVVVVADRTLSMTVPLGCTINGGSCTDYRTALVNGIKSMLEVMTPEQQYVALGALGPSAATRSTAESKACNSSAEGLVYPSANVGTSSSGSWIPIKFKNDYLGAPDANGVRVVNTTNKLIQAINCLDDVSADKESENRLSDTRTALASPMKAAARYLLGRTSDGNNIGSLGGGNRSGVIKQVIIFETDGEPFENATSSSASALSLNNETDIFSKYTDFVDSGPVTSGPVLANAANGSPNTLNPDPPAPAANQLPTYPAKYTYNNRDYTYTYKYRTNTTTKAYTRASTGGQKACDNFKAIANQAKQAGILVITIGYNLDSATKCSDSNSAAAPPSPANAYNQPWISDISPATTACRTGNGTQASPFVPKTSCAQNMTVTYTVPNTYTAYSSVTGAGDASVTSVLADASGGGDVPAASSNGCTTTALIAAENADDDLFFCAAQGQDMSPLFITALSKVTKGVKLMNLP